MAIEPLTTGKYLAVYTPEFFLADVNINPDIQKHPYMMITMQLVPE